MDKELKTYVKFRLKKEINQLKALPLETEIKIKWPPGKGKFDKLRVSSNVVEKAHSDKDKVVIVSNKPPYRLTSVF